MIEKQLDFSATKIAAVHVSVKIANNINLWKIHDTFYNALDLMHEVRQEATEEVERRNNHEKKKKIVDSVLVYVWLRYLVYAYTYKEGSL